MVKIEGYVNIIEGTGDNVLFARCSVVARTKEFGVAVVVKNSAKVVYLVPAYTGAAVIFSPLIRWIDATCFNKGAKS